MRACAVVLAALCAWMSAPLAAQPMAAAQLVVATQLVAPERSAVPERSAACGCPAADARGLAGVVWRDGEALRLADVASLVAPVLWFSGSEPLLAPGRGPVPSAHPCDRPASEPIVYYQVVRISYRGDARLARADENTPAFFDQVTRLTLRFFFYYPEDIGKSGHVHDLEGADFDIALEHVGPCRQLRIVRVEGLAHGNRWYSNLLDVGPDTRLPLTLLVARGKHASAPDRNADGRFERGYDVTSRRNDARGLGEPENPGVTRADDTRTADSRLLPPVEPRLCLGADASSIDDRPGLGRYALRPASHVAACDIPGNGTFLTDMMAYHGFGEAHQPAQFRAGSLLDGLGGIGGPDQWLSLNLRGTGSRLGAAVIVRGLDLGPGWLVPRVLLDDVVASVEGMFTRSASRPVDVYVSAGAERQFETVIENDTAVPPNWSMAIEGGVKFRIEIPPGARPFVLGCNFGGVRVGLRGTGFPTTDRWQVVWEAGIGAW